MAHLREAGEVGPTTVPSPSPRVLVFSTNGISDLGIDLAGSSHMDYPAGVRVIALPCSGGINPGWIVHALTAGFDGVFVAADGKECALLSDCVDRTGRIVEEAQRRLVAKGIDPARVKTAAICSVCSEPFVNHMRQFGQSLTSLPPRATA